GVDSLILSLFCFIGACRGRFNGWYRYIIKPGLLLISVLTVVASSICMGNLSNVNDAMFLLFLMLIILPAVAFFVVAFLPASLFVGSVARPDRPKPAPSKQPVVSSPKAAAGVSSPKAAAGVSSYRRLWALILSAGSLFGICGLQRFYVGKIGTGILWFLTGGLFGIGQLIDVIMICTGQFQDCYGLPLELWYDSDEVKAKTPAARMVDQVGAVKKDVAVANDQRAEAVHAPAAGDSPARPAAAAPTTTIIYERFHPLAFLFSGIGFILTFIAVMIGLAVALHLPHVIATGWPRPDMMMYLENTLGSNWPQILMDMGRIVFIVLMLPAAVCVSISRRHLGACHLIRGILGLGGLLSAVLLLADGMYWKFRSVETATGTEELGPILERILKGCQSQEAVFAAIIFVISVIILSWPAKPRKMMLNPALNQGVS
ncbi:MAG: TM2 domain-containing protein, partial [Planctomycetota bacterium]